MGPYSSFSGRWLPWCYIGSNSASLIHLILWRNDHVWEKLFKIEYIRELFHKCLSLAFFKDLREKLMGWWTPGEHACERDCSCWTQQNVDVGHNSVVDGSTWNFFYPLSPPRTSSRWDQQKYFRVKQQHSVVSTNNTPSLEHGHLRFITPLVSPLYLQKLQKTDPWRRGLCSILNNFSLSWWFINKTKLTEEVEFVPKQHHHHDDPR